MAIYWPTPGLKGRTFKLCVLTRWDFNFCIRSSPLLVQPGKHNRDNSRSIKGTLSLKSSKTTTTFAACSIFHQTYTKGHLCYSYASQTKQVCVWMDDQNHREFNAKLFFMLLWLLIKTESFAQRAFSFTAQLNGIYCLMDSDTMNLLLHLKQLSKPIFSDLLFSTC